MKLDTSINLEKEKIISGLEYFWKRVYKILFFVSLVCVIVFGAYIWNQNLYSSTWSNAKKQAFMGTQDKGVVFNENNYRKALEIISQRSQNNAKAPDVGKDFFLPY